MILRSVTLKNFRGYREPVTATFTHHPFQIIEGSNGAGKSTLIVGVQQALLTNHDSKSQELQKLRPRGTSLAPEVTVEFEHGGVEYRLWKRFLDKPKATLERCKAGRFEKVSENKQADNDARAMVGAAGSGDGRLQVLLASQSGLRLPELSGHLVADIQTMLGGQLTDSRGWEFEKRARKRYEMYYTPAKGAEKGEIVTLRRELEGAEELQRTAEFTLEQIEESRRRASAAQKRMDGFHLEIQSLQPELSVAEELEKQAQSLESRLAVARPEESAAQLRWRDEHLRVEGIQDAGKKLARLRDQEPQRTKASKSGQNAHQKAKAAVEAAYQEYTAFDKPDPQAEEIRRLHGDAVQWHRVESELRTHKLLAMREKVTGEIRSLNAPDPATLKRIGRLDEEIGRIGVQLDALLLRVCLTAERAVKAVEIKQGEPSGKHSVAQSGTLIATGEGEVTVRLPGIASIQITGPSGNAAELRGQIARRQAEREAAVAPYGSPSTAELAERAEQAGELTRGLAQLDGELVGRHVSATREDVTEQRAVLLAAHTDWADSAPEPQALADQLKKLLEARESERQKARTQWEACDSVEKAKAAAARDAEDALRDLNQKIQTLVEELAKLQSDGLCFDERLARLERLKQDWDEARKRVSDLEFEESKLPPDAASRAGGLRGRIADLEHKAGEARTEIRAEEVRQSTWLAQSPWSGLTEAEESVAALREGIAALELKMESARRIWLALSGCKDEALEGLVDPVSKTATRFVEEIAGEPLARVSLTRDFQSETVFPGDGEQGEAAVEDMSGGEREQIWFATRLALADLLVGEERHFVVFDDVFSYTDSTRLARILALLEARRGTMQLLILTCHPERYAAVADANWLHVEACRIRNAAVGAS